MKKFQDRFSEIYSIQGLKKIRARAIEKICRIEVKGFCSAGQRAYVNVRTLRSSALLSGTLHAGRCTPDTLWERFLPMIFLHSKIAFAQEVPRRIHRR